MPIRVSETCQNISGHVKRPWMVIRRTCPFFATCKALLKLQDDMPQADIDQDDVSLAGMCCKVQLVAQSNTPRVRARRCWAIIRVF